MRATAYTLLALITHSSHGISYGGEISYRVAIVDFRERGVLFADFETGSVSSIDITDELEREPLAIEASTSGEIYVASDGEPGQLAILDPNDSMWTIIRIPGGVISIDLDLLPNGNLIRAFEGGIDEINPKTGEGTSPGLLGRVDNTGFTPPSNSHHVEVAGPQSFVTHNFLEGDGTAIIQYTIGDSRASRIDVPMRLFDYVIESEQSLLAIALTNQLVSDGNLYRISLDTADVEVISDSGIFADSIRLAVDPDGRVLALKNKFDGSPTNSLLRFDIETGASEVLELGRAGVLDFAIVVPEPSGFLLCCIAFLVTVIEPRGRRHAP